MTGATPVTVWLDGDMKSLMRAVADADNRTSHYVIKKAIEVFVSRKEERQEELRIVKERLEAFELHGISHSLKDVKQRLAKYRLNFETSSEASSVDDLHTSPNGRSV